MDKKTRVYDLLTEIEDILETAPKATFSKKVSVDPDEIMEIIDDLKQILPEEIIAARSIVEQERELATQAKQRAEQVLKQAQEKATTMVDNNTILQQAKLEAQDILDDATSAAYDISMGTYGYIDSILYDFEEEVLELKKYVADALQNNVDQNFQAVLTELGNNRDEIKQLADEAHETFARGEFPKAPDADSEEDGDDY